MLKRLFGARAAAPDSAEACFRLGSELIEAGRQRLYRDAEPLEALQRFIETVVA